ncbi:MAG: GTPase [Planctomycetota bacterium]
MSFEFAVSSAPGAAALGCVTVWGGGAEEALRRCFVPRRSGALDRFRYGEIRDVAGERIDDGCVLPTGDDRFVITLHGNPVLVSAVIDRLSELGGRPAEAERASFFPERATIEAEALRLVSRARRESIAGWLLRQADPDGTGFAAWVRNQLECGEPSDPAAVREVRARGQRGRLFDPPTVVLTGVPNAGKSTLFNRWVGRTRVVEHPEPGTTRDVIRERVELRGFPIELVDGAGIRSAEDAIEREGVSRVQRVIAEADLVVELHPPGTPFGPEKDRTLKIRSRLDQIAEHVEERRPEEASFLGISSVTGAGVRQLEEVVLRRLFGATELDDQPAPFTTRHLDLLDEVLDLLERGQSDATVWTRF